ncbi:BtpA/SgcQ family protein [Actinotalea sp. Marseille-Q4924]|uniref:BtpA/SgcQ family protein n=1 Tax=Actinotalea sp. Marseille-Q4924 TaxID=2866571 RepID=UPI001CE43F65|nr:BtpA/SgcQ family protein [Actinotalea sp. Marseille-Q4924]
MSRLLESFPSAIPVFAMLHHKGENPADVQERARREIDVLWSAGVDAVIVENYFGGIDDVVATCEYLRSERPEVVFGINVLRDDAGAFRLARDYGARFVQLDSVAGHLPPAEDAEFADWLAAERAASDLLVLGGVRFKYQPVSSGRSLEEDLLLGVERCDAIVVTGEGTAITTPHDKTGEFRRIVGEEFPLVIGAGVTPSSAADDLADADAVVVGSALKDTCADTGDVEERHARELVDAVRALTPRPGGMRVGTPDESGASGS